MMIGQSYLYLNNKKYATSLSNLDSLMEEVSSFYSQSSTPRKVVIVSMGGVPVVELSVKEAAVRIIKKFNPTITVDSDLSSMLEFKSMDDVDSMEYIGNGDKEFLVFTNDYDLYTLYFKYIDSIFSSIADYDINRLKDFAMHVLRRDIDFSFTDFLTDDYIIDIIDNVFVGNQYGTTSSPHSKQFSYDLLFYMNDHMPDNVVSLPILKQKFSIHSNKLVNEMLQQMVGETTIISPVMGILNYLTSIGDTMYNRNTITTGVWQNENRSEALYLLNGFIQYIDTVPGLVDKLEAQESAIYFEIWSSLKKELPIIITFLEGGFDTLNGPEMRSLWTEVEFLHRRRSRIPYLLWSVKPLI
jgi:hypothetical protein